MLKVARPPHTTTSWRELQGSVGCWLPWHLPDMHLNVHAFEHGVHAPSMQGSYLFYFSTRKNILQASSIVCHAMWHVSLLRIQQGLVHLTADQAAALDPTGVGKGAVRWACVRELVAASSIHIVKHTALSCPQIETELPPSVAANGSLAKPSAKAHPITITLSSQHAFSCQHPFYVLLAPSQEVQTAWCNALWQVGEGKRRSQFVHAAGRGARLSTTADTPPPAAAAHCAGGHPPC